MKDIELKIPRPELRFVSPDVRIKLFSHLVNEYKRRYPELDMIYASLFWGNMNTEKNQSEVLVHRITGQYITGSAKVDGIANAATSPLVVKKKIAFPSANQDIQVDYCIIWESPYEDKVYFDLPYIHTNRSIPGYRYCVRENKLDLWFQLALEDMANLDTDKFAEYIESHMKLSLDEESDLFWKKNENKVKLVSSLIDLGLRYTKKV